MAAITSTQNTFRIGHPDPTIDCPILQREALKKAIAQVKDNYPKEFEDTFAQHNSSEEELLDFLSNSLKGGSCGGMSDVLFDQIVRKNSSSLAHSMPLLNSEDIFYHQILLMLFAHIKNQKKDSTITVVFKDMKYISKSREEYETLYDSIKKHVERTRYDLSRKGCEMLYVSMKGHLPPPIGFLNEDFLRILNVVSEKHTRLQKEFWDSIGKREKEFEAQCDKQIARISRNLHLITFSDSEKFSVTATHGVYKKTLETAMDVFSQSEDFVGVLYLPQHGIGFQYGPRGYFLFDPIHSSKGLFAYPHRERFLEGVMRHALEDVCSYGQRDIIPFEDLNLNEDFFNVVRGIQIHFSIRPLNAINPTHREPVKREPVKKIRDKQEALRTLVLKEGI